MSEHNITAGAMESEGTILALIPGALLDQAHLSRQTLGDRALAQEVLRLFADQAPGQLSALEPEAGAQAWFEAAHSLKGSARAIGAFKLATLAGEAEEKRAAPRAERASLAARLRVVLAATLSHIESALVTA